MRVQDSSSLSKKFPAIFKLKERLEQEEEEEKQNYDKNSDSDNNDNQFEEDTHYYWSKTKPFFTMVNEGRLSCSRVKLLSHDMDHNVNKEYYSFNSFRALWKFVSQDKKTPHYHEVFTSPTILKENVYTSLFYDIEKAVKTTERESEEPKIKKLIENINSVVIHIILSSLLQLDKENYKTFVIKIMIQNSSGMTSPEDFKISYHINLLFTSDKNRMIVFDNIREIKALFLKAILTLDSESFNYLKENGDIGHKIFDFSIYSDNRSLRCLYSSNRNNKHRILTIESFKKYIILKNGMSGFMEREDESNEEENFTIWEVKDLKKSLEENFYHSLNLKPIYWIKQKNPNTKLLYLEGFLPTTIVDDDNNTDDAASTSSNIPMIFQAIFQSSLFYYTNKESSSSSSSSSINEKSLSGFLLSSSLSSNVSMSKKKMMAIQTISKLMEKWISLEIKKINKKTCSGTISYKSDYSIIKTGYVEQLKHHYQLMSKEIQPNHPNDFLMLQFGTDVTKRLCVDYHYCLFESTYKFCFIKGQEHKSNHVYYVVNLWSMGDQIVWYQKCYDELCASITLKKKKKQGEREENKKSLDETKGKSRVFSIPQEDVILMNQIRDALLDVEIYRYTGFTSPSKNEGEEEKKRKREEIEEKEEEGLKQPSLKTKITSSNRSSLMQIFNKW